MRSLPRLVVALLLGPLLGVAACGKDDDGGRRVLLTIWSDYMPPEVLEDFRKETGVRVEIPARYGSNEELLAKLQNGDSGFDLAVPTDYALAAMITQGLVERLDAAKLPNRKHLDPSFAERQTDPKGEWSVPYTWGTLGIAWRTDRIAGDVDSWGVFGTDRAKGNAHLLEEARDVVCVALLFLGRDPNSVAEKDLADAKAVLLDWKKNVKAFSSETKTALVSGDAWLCQAYNGDVAKAMLERKDLRYAVPKEGGIFWIDNFVIPKGAPHKDDAHLFLDYILRPAVAARISEGIRYAVCNRDALPLLPASVRDDPVIYAPEDVRARCHQEKDIGKDLPRIVDLWSEVYAEK